MLSDSGSDLVQMKVAAIQVDSKSIDKLKAASGAALVEFEFFSPVCSQVKVQSTLM